MKENTIAMSKTIKLYAYGILAFAIVSGICGFLSSGLISLILWIGFLFFGFIAVIIFLSMSDHGFALKIDDEGITDQTPMLGVGLIPWEHIIDIHVDEINGQHCLLLKVADTQIYLNRLTLSQRVIPFLRQIGSGVYQNNFLPIHFGSLAADNKSVYEWITSEWEKKKIVSKENHPNDRSRSSHAQKTVNQSNGPTPASGTGGVSISDLEALEKLAELRDKNIITEEEFAAKKNQIIGF